MSRFGRRKKKRARDGLWPVILISCRTRARLGPQRIGLGPKFEARAGL